jgi:hypothetical protein
VLLECEACERQRFPLEDPARAPDPRAEARAELRRCSLFRVPLVVRKSRQHLHHTLADGDFARSRGEGA